VYTSRKSHHHHYFTSFAVITAQADGTAPILSFQDLQRHPQWLKVQQRFFPEYGLISASCAKHVEAAAAAPSECAPFVIAVYTFSYSRVPESNALKHALERPRRKATRKEKWSGTESGSVHSSPSRRVEQRPSLTSDHGLISASCAKHIEAAAAAPGECAPFVITVYTFSYSRSKAHCKNAVRLTY
jgi:hypothetical protein